jgi:hypothetical protein
MTSQSARSFGSEEAAADACMKQIGRESIDCGLEMYSVIYRYTENNNRKYSYSRPEKGGPGSSIGVVPTFLKIAMNNVFKKIPELNDKNVAPTATVHTHGSWEGADANGMYGAEGPSAADIFGLGALGTMYALMPSGNAYKTEGFKGLRRIYGAAYGAYCAKYRGGGAEYLGKLTPWRTGYAFDPADPWHHLSPAIRVISSCK